MPKLLTTQQVASMLGISTRKVQMLLQRKCLPGFRIGRVWRIAESDLERYLERLRAAAQVRP